MVSTLLLATVRHAARSYRPATPAASFRACAPGAAAPVPPASSCLGMLRPGQASPGGQFDPAPDAVPNGLGGCPEQAAPPPAIDGYQCPGIPEQLIGSPLGRGYSLNSDRVTNA